MDFAYWKATCSITPISEGCYLSSQFRKHILTDTPIWVKSSYEVKQNALEGVHHIDEVKLHVLVDEYLGFKSDVGVSAFFEIIHNCCHVLITPPGAVENDIWRAL
jgi:hypothetical protein